MLTKVMPDKIKKRSFEFILSVNSLRDVIIPIPFGIGIDIDIDPFHLKNKTSQF
jgi:hypothetical protein